MLLIKLIILIWVLCIIVWQSNTIRSFILEGLSIFFKFLFLSLVFIITCGLLVSFMVSWNLILNVSYLFNDFFILSMLDPSNEGSAAIPEVGVAIEYYFKEPRSLIFLTEAPRLSVTSRPIGGIQPTNLDAFFSPLRTLANRNDFDLVRDLTAVGKDEYFTSFATFNPLLYNALHHFSYVSAKISGHLVDAHNLVYPGYELRNLQWLNSATEFGYNSLLVMDKLYEVSSASALTSGDRALTLPPIIWPYSLPPLVGFNDLGTEKVTQFYSDYALLHDICSRIVNLSTKLTRSNFFKLFLDANPQLSKDYQPLYFNSLSARLGYHLNLLAHSFDISSNPFPNASSSDDYMGLIAAKAGGRTINLRLLLG